MELETIWGWRLRVLMARTTSLEGRVSTLEDLSTKSLQRSDNRWQQVRGLAELAGSIGSIVGALARHWGLLLLAATTIWAFVLPGLKWVWRAISYLAGLLSW